MGSIPVRVTTKERFASASRSFAIPGLDNFRRPDYNKNTRRCPLQTGTSPRWKPDGCHKHRTYRDERLAFKAVSRLFQQTAHFFLSCRYSTRDTMLAMEPKAPRTVSSVEVICIASLGRISRESRLHASIPLSRDGRQPSFTVHRLIDKNGGFSHRLLYRLLHECQINSHIVKNPICV